MLPLDAVTVAAATVLAADGAAAVPFPKKLDAGVVLGAAAGAAGVLPKVKPPAAGAGAGVVVPKLNPAIMAVLRMIRWF